MERIDNQTNIKSSGKINKETYTKGYATIDFGREDENCTSSGQSIKGVGSVTIVSRKGRI